jgi:putative DNA primase/helicase
MLMMLTPLPREAILQPNWWRSSPPVPRLTKPERPAPAPLPAEQRGLWVEALDALLNDGKHSLTYEQWFAVICGIHHETDGSDAGLELAEQFSARSPKADLEFLRNRVWPYVTSYRGGSVTTGGSIMHLAAKMHGWSGGAAKPTEDVFDVVHEHSSGRIATHQAYVESSDGDVDAAELARVMNLLQPIERRSLPDAKHLCSDQANAVRIVKTYGSRVLMCGGKWYSWTGAYWKPGEEGEADVYRYACHLSRIVMAEAAELRRKAKERMENDGATEHMEKASKIAEALDKWSTKCESKGTIEAAIGLARKMLIVTADKLDRDPMLLNCRNGTVDLRTGTLREHNYNDYITKMVDVDFDPAVRCAEWEKAVIEITQHADVASFLKRWFGYCATGSVAEQSFVVHWGDGGNGKSTIIKTISTVLGAYAGTAAPGMIASSGNLGERHPTELAALFGKRMVTAHETKDGAVLNDDVIKHITGDDVISARYMREDFFDFKPTHKTQLLTNAKPTIKGQDKGIWRRVKLVGYTAHFGTAEQVAKGEATHVGDKNLMTLLSTPAASQGVLTWIVEGAQEWVRMGLKPPTQVMELTKQYQNEQDRVKQFVEECCAVGSADQEGFFEPLTNGPVGIYPSYQGWCKDAGVHALARQRFSAELLRAFPVLRIEPGNVGKGEARRKILQVKGLRLLPD